MRCVNLDWLEVSAEESVQNYPCNADFFRTHGYFVTERDYGTRVWGEMFTIEDSDGHPWIEVRRNPPSGESSFTGLNEFSCRLRLVNSQCYVTDCIERLRVFMLTFGYHFKKIYRIDIAYDFEYFDSGDKPSRFARLYVERKFRKVNQCHLRADAQDNWADYEWETLSWGSPHSMVSTKLYNKSKEIRTVSKEKVYIKRAWFESGLVDDPVNFLKVNSQGEKYEPEIWRLEYSMKSKAERWLVIEDVSGKRERKRAVQHTLDLFDSPDKLWQRFEELTFHYFHFKIRQYKDERDDQGELVLKRKNLCPDKRLFYFNKDREFLQIDNNVPSRKPSLADDTLKRRLLEYQNSHADSRIRSACAILIQELDNEALSRLTPKRVFSETEALRRVLALRMKYPDVEIVQTIAEIQKMLFNDEMF